MSAEPKRVELTEDEREVVHNTFMHEPEPGVMRAVVETIVAAHVAAARREALLEAREDIRERRRRFAGLGCDEQYLLAMDDCFGLVNNRLSAALAESERDEEGGR